jgi:hypothetical protein
MKVQVSHRLDESLLAWATEYGESRKASRSSVIETALRHFQELAKSGVPDLPEDAPPSREQQEANKAALKRARREAAADTPREASLRVARELGWMG